VGIQAVTNARRLGAILRETAPAIQIIEAPAPRQASLFDD
jgi:hypothetical protein